MPGINRYTSRTDMKRLIIFIVAGIAALAATSCDKDNTLRYNNFTMGNIVDGKFVSDQGNTFNVVEQTCSGRLDTLERAIILCDILYQEEGGDYAVRLNNFQKVLTKAPVKASETTDESILKRDPIILSDLWISGGYINMLLTLPVKMNSKQPHIINLMLDDAAQAEGAYKFTLLHNAGGEILKADSSNNDVYLANAYVSFPVTSILTEETANFQLTWTSYKVNGQYMISADTVEQTYEFNYVKGAFEQAPAEGSAKVSSLSLR